MFKPFDYTKVSLVHRRARRRRRAKRAVQLGWVLGIVVLVTAGVLAAPTWASDSGGRTRLVRLTEWYLVVGVGCLLGLGLGRMLRSGAWHGGVSSRQRSARRRRRSRAAHSLVSTHRWDHAGHPNDARRGVVLLIVLILLALVSSVALNAQLAARWAFREETARWDALRLRRAAADGVRQAMGRLAADRDLRVDHLEEAWAQAFEDTDPEGVVVRVEVVDEDRYFDLNNLALPERPGLRAPKAVLVDLLTLCGDVRPSGRAQSLLDWVDADDLGLREDAHYAEKQPPYETPDRLVLAWSELRWVEGFAPFLSALTDVPAGPQDPPPRLVEVATVVPIQRKGVLPVNVNTAGEATLRGVLGIDRPDLLRALIGERERGPIRGFDTSRLAIDPDLVQQLAPYLSVRSVRFRIRAEADLGEHVQRVIALVQRDERGRVEMLRWAQQ